MSLQIAYRQPPDLMPAGFAEGLEDWSCGDGAPESRTYTGAPDARLVEDADFGGCLELTTTLPVQRLRYTAEVPIRAGHFIEVSSRLKVMRGPLPSVRVSVYAGGRPGQHLFDLPEAGPTVGLAAHGTVFEVSAVIGPESCGGVHMVWEPRARYAHIGIDLMGEAGSKLRVGKIAVCDVTRRFRPLGPVLPGFEDL